MKKFQLFKIAAVAALALAGLTMNACSDSSSGSSKKSANFVDSAVVGIGYKASPSGLEGVTDADGKFEYKTGDTVTFFIGGIELPPIIPTDEYLTPAHWASSEDWDTDQLVINIAIFLQSLDADGNLKNGIQIPEGADKALEDMDFDFGSSFSYYMSTVINHLNDNLKDLEVELVLVLGGDAIAHLEATIDELGITIVVDTTACNMTERAGVYNADFSRLGAGPYKAGDHLIELGSDRTLSIGAGYDLGDLEEVASFCSYSKATVGSGEFKITTETYTWVEGTNEVYALIITGDIMTLTVTIDQTVNGTFENIEPAIM
jgi:hypothetical protein